MQHPLLGLLDDGDAIDVEAWEAHAQVDIATLIDLYLRQRPSPGPSRHHDLFQRWAQELRVAGEARLTAVGDRRLRVA